MKAEQKVKGQPADDGCRRMQWRMPKDMTGWTVYDGWLGWEVCSGGTHRRVNEILKQN